MKHTFFMLFVSIAISFMACEGGGENDENLPADNGNTEKPKDDETQEPVVCSITPIESGDFYYKFPCRCYETFIADDELSDACDYGGFLSPLSSYKKNEKWRLYSVLSQWQC